jgi:polysaccharide pyruvyl transferase WcaK-like protein
MGGLKKRLTEILGILSVLVFQMKLRRMLSKSINLSGEFVYIWIPPRLDENLGDLGMATVFEESFKDQKVIYISNNSSILNFKTLNKTVYFNHQKDQRNLFACISQYQPKRLIIVGADTLDGAYGAVESIFKLSTALNFQTSSIQSYLVNVSWNAKKLNLLLKLILTLTSKVGAKFLVRDVVSFSRLESKGVNSVLSADLVFNLKPKPRYPLKESFEDWKSQNRPIVAVGFGVPLDQDPNYFEQMVEVCRYLLSNSYAIVLSPSGSSKSDLDLNFALLSSLNNERVFYYQNISSSYEFVELLSTADFGITNRMHFVIHALLVHVPSIGVEYQGKFEGLYDFLTMRAFNLQSLFEISSTIGPFVEELQISKRKIAKSLPHLIELSRKNFS